MEQVLDILQDLKEDIDFEETKDLIDGGYLDSFDILQLISDLNDEFDISIPAAKIIPQNFNSAEAIWNMVQELMDK